jgi:hypothetical protein
MPVITTADLVEAHDNGVLIPWAQNLFDRFAEAVLGVDVTHPAALAVIDITDFLLRVIEDAPFDPDNPVNGRDGHDDRYAYYLNLAIAVLAHPMGAAVLAREDAPA